MPTCLNFGTKGHFHSILPYHALYYPTEFWEVIFCHWKLLAASIKPEFIHAVTQKKNTSFYAFSKTVKKKTHKELSLALLNTTSIHHFEPIFNNILQLEAPFPLLF
jgi:hypothetical protein